MKFEYDDEVVGKKLVAIIHKAGSLIIQCDKDCIVFDSEGACNHKEDLNVEFWEDMAVKKFYPGDKITITF